MPIQANIGDEVGDIAGMILKDIALPSIEVECLIQVGMVDNVAAHLT